MDKFRGMPDDSLSVAQLADIRPAALRAAPCSDSMFMTQYSSSSIEFRHTRLENGLEIIAEIQPQAQSAALGFFVQTGARDEDLAVSGVSHFLEHMAFKGDNQYSAEDVNRIFDEVGASYNASTSEEMTIYHAAILPEYLEQTLSLMAAMMRPSLRESDFEVEKKVILEEIGMYEDMPAFSAYEQAMLQHFSGHPLGQRVLGTTDSITALTAAQMRSYHAERYGAGNLVLSAAGQVDWDTLVQLAERNCGHWQTGSPGRNRPASCPLTSSQFQVRPEWHQEHVMAFGVAPSLQDRQRLVAEIAASIMGDDGAGRLYWELVETGHAESCDLGYNEFDSTGVWCSYLCCQPEDTAANLRRIQTLHEEFNRTGPGQEEFEQARNKIATRLVLESERPLGRMLEIGTSWSTLQEFRSTVDDLALLNALTLQDIRKLLQAYPLTAVTTVGMGAYSAGESR